MERVFILKYEVMYGDGTMLRTNKVRVFSSFSAAEKFVRDYGLAKNNKQIINHTIEVYKVYEQ